MALINNRELDFDCVGHMIKKINVAGLQLDNYSVHEAMMELERHVDSGQFYTIEEVTMDMLLAAGNDDAVRAVLSSLDQTVIAENGILDAAGIKNVGRKREIENRAFFFELLKRLERNHRSIFVLGETEAVVTALRDFVEQEFPRITFAGAEAMENCPGTADAMINEINAATPYAILSVLPSPAQEYFLNEHKEKLFVRLWYGIGGEPSMKRRFRLIRFLKDKIRVHQLLHFS